MFTFFVQKKNPIVLYKYCILVSFIIKFFFGYLTRFNYIYMELIYKKSRMCVTYQFWL
ncbi:hypothetical protein RhiirB3_54404 [Rhizophagus irregularis]|nr:hypothetical protein RhiirB3_54404 [Rhizophagus irregularis]